MRNSILTGLLAAAAIGIASPAYATATVDFSDGNGGLSAGETMLASFDGGVPTYGGVTGGGYIIQSGSNTSGADPHVGTMGDPYLSVLAGGSAIFTFAGGLSQLGLDYGSADAYNTFLLSFANGTTQSLTGSDIINSPPANGDQASQRTNGRLTFSAGTGPAITGLTLSSSQNSLEVDNLGKIGAVPEPATWAMMLVGFGAVGFSMRRRSRPVLQAA